MDIQHPPVVTDEDTQTIATSQVTTQPTLRDRIEPWWEATLAIFPTFLYTRFLFILLTYFGVVLFTIPNYSPHALTGHTLLYSWYRWDAARFVSIAFQGYKTFDDAAFFPLFPLLVSGVSQFLGKGTLLAGMLVSNGAFLVMLVVLYRFVEVEFDRETAKRTTLYISIFPTALFFFAAYNESLFILFALLFFYALRRGSWWLAGIFGGLAMLTRSLGLLLLPIFLYEFVRQVFPRVKQAWHEKRRWHVLRLLSSLLAAALIPLGLGIFAYYLNQRYHDPLAFAHAESHWHIGPTFPWVGLIRSFKWLWRLSPFTFASPHILIDLTAFGLFCVLLVLCFVGPKRFSRSQWYMLIFAALALVYPLLFPRFPDAHSIPYDPLPSMERYVLEIFPCFILLARLGKRPWFHQAYLLLALPLLAFFTLQLVNNHWTV